MGSIELMLLQDDVPGAIVFCDIFPFHSGHRIATYNTRSEGWCPRFRFVGAGWSSPVARQAHNLKVAGSNPAPATNYLLEIKWQCSRQTSRESACACGDHAGQVRRFAMPWTRSSRLPVKPAGCAETQLCGR